MNTETTASANQHTCPACRAHFVPFTLGNKDGYTLISCRACGSVMANPQPTQEQLDTYYGDIQPESVHVANPDREIDHIAKVLRKSLPVPVAGKDRMLIVNVQNGYSLAAAQKIGWKATGLNMHEFMHRFASTHYSAAHFVHATLPEYAAQTQEKFNAIVCSASFTEHRDLDAFAAALKKLLADGGVIYLEEPDGNHFNTPRDFAMWNSVEPPVTCTTLSKKGLGKLLNRHGITVKKTWFTWAPYTRMLAGHSRKS